MLRGGQPGHRDVPVPWYGGTVGCTVWSGSTGGRRCFFIEPDPAAGFFARDRLYGYGDDAERFAFFSKAALEFLARAGKRPDVIHCHDWQTGLGRPDHFLDAARLGHDFRYRGLNPMKGGILYANFVTTVSPNYADYATVPSSLSLSRSGSPLQPSHKVAIDA